MSIEFSCAQCGQHLRVSEEAAGKRAKCPKCAHVNQIPKPTAPLEDDDSDLNLMPEVPQKPTSPFPQADSNPYSSPQAGFGSQFESQSKSPFGRTEISNVPTEIGDILNYSFELWKEHLGILVGATVVIYAIGIAISYGMMLIVAVIQNAGQPEAAATINILGSFFGQAIQIFLNIGLIQMMLKMARNQPAEFSDVFNGGERFWPSLGIAILFGLFAGFGFLLLIVPGIIIWLMFWPCFYLVIDNKSRVFDSFGTAQTITQNNFGTSILMWLLGLGITVIGFLACCVGLIAAIPLAEMIKVVAYLMMSGQIPAQGKPSFDRHLVS